MTLLEKSDQSAEVYVEALARKSGSSFLAGMRVLSAQKRRAMFAVYAFCREVDDIADEEGTPAQKQRQLGEWRTELDFLFDGLPQSSIGQALLAPVEHYGLRKSDFLAVIDGMEVDAQPSVRIADDAALATYCDRVAGAVGRLSCGVFGVPRQLGDPLSDALGQALQLTNILRDFHEDGLRDRLYAPISLLHEHGIPADAEVVEILNHPAFPNVCGVLAARTRKFFAEAEVVIAKCERRAVRPAAIMMEVYRCVFIALGQRGWDGPMLERGVRVSSARKLWIVLRHGVF